MKTTLLNCAIQAGKILKRCFNAPLEISYKGDPSNIVTSADLASEKRIIELIRQRFPDDGILAEETGFQPGKTGRTWVIDPLDGTSNYAAGLPWYGVLLAVLKGAEPIMGAMYLPETDTLYYAEAGQATTRNGLPIRVTSVKDLRELLCACCMDSSKDADKTRQQVEGLERLISRVRNIRATNCLLDVCYTLDGRLGACINFNAKIWDIAACCLLMREAGGILTDLAGRELDQCWDLQDPMRSYAFVGASRGLHAQVLGIIQAGKQAEKE